MLSFGFEFSVGYRGFCHRTESDLLLSLFIIDFLDFFHKYCEEKSVCIGELTLLEYLAVKLSQNFKVIKS